MRALTTVAIAAHLACAPSAPATTAPTNAAAPDRPERIVRGQYIGAEVGLSIVHLGGPTARQRLPEGLEHVSAINVADGWHFTVARRAGDLVILLIDGRGVVVDDVTLRGRAAAEVIVGECASSFIGIAAAGACDEAETARAEIGWDRRGRALVASGAQSCGCDLARLDGP